MTKVRDLPYNAVGSSVAFDEHELLLATVSNEGEVGKIDGFVAAGLACPSFIYFASEVTTEPRGLGVVAVDVDRCLRVLGRPVFEV